MKPNGKKSSSWEGITPEQKAERVRKMVKSKAATIEDWKKSQAHLEQERAAERQRQALQRYKDFMNSPHWLSSTIRLEPKYLDKIYNFLSDVFGQYKTLADSHKKERETFFAKRKKIQDKYTEKGVDYQGNADYESANKNTLDALDGMIRASEGMEFALLLQEAVFYYAKGRHSRNDLVTITGREN